MKVIAYMLVVCSLYTSLPARITSLPARYECREVVPNHIKHTFATEEECRRSCDGQCVEETEENVPEETQEAMQQEQ